MTIKEIRKMALMSQGKFSDAYDIPIRTLVNWECSGLNHREPPKYVLELLERVVREDVAKLAEKIKAVDVYQVYTQDGSDIFTGRSREFELEADANAYAAQKRAEGLSVKVEPLHISQREMMAAENCVDD